MIEIAQIYEILGQCWSAKTSSKFEAGNPSKGQCSVTALLIQNTFGGSILKTNVNGQWHFYNKLEDQIIDFTSEQFSDPIHYENIEASVEETKNDTTEKQYEHLRQQFDRLSTNTDKSH